VQVSLAAGDCVLRPTFSALVAAEAEVGSLLALLDRAGAGDVRLGDIGPLFWHALAEPEAWADRGAFEAQLAEAGLRALIPPYRRFLSSVFGGRR
jgi:hypothetical protein